MIECIAKRQRLQGIREFHVIDALIKQNTQSQTSESTRPIDFKALSKIMSKGQTLKFTRQIYIFQSLIKCYAKGQTLKALW